MLLVVAIGCFAVILLENEPMVDTAAFGLLGVIVSSLAGRSRPPR